LYIVFIGNYIYILQPKAKQQSNRLHSRKRVQLRTYVARRHAAAR